MDPQDQACNTWKWGSMEAHRPEQERPRGMAVLFCGFVCLAALSAPELASRYRCGELSDMQKRRCNRRPSPPVIQR